MSDAYVWDVNATRLYRVQGSHPKAGFLHFSKNGMQQMKFPIAQI